MIDHTTAVGLAARLATVARTATDRETNQATGPAEQLHMAVRAARVAGVAVDDVIRGALIAARREGATEEAALAATSLMYALENAARELRDAGERAAANVDVLARKAASAIGARHA